MPPLWLGAAGRVLRRRCSCSSARTGKTRADPALRLAARRDGRPDAGLGAHPRRDHGHRRRLHGRAPARPSTCSRPRRWRSSPSSARSTALFAAIIGFAQNDIKKVLAYSTVSQLGFMFVGRRHRQLRRRRSSTCHARVLQGLPVPRRRLGHARHERRRGDITTMGGLRKKHALDARRVPRLLPRDRRHPAVLRLLLEGRDPRAARSRREHLPGWPGLGTASSSARAARWRRWAPRSTCRASTSSCSRARRAPTTRPSTTSTSRRASMTVPLVVLAIGAALVGFLGLPAAALLRPRRAANLLAPS